MSGHSASDDESAIRRLLGDYEAALNESSTSKAVALYTADGVFMAEYSPSSVGTAAVTKAYEAVFSAITLSVRFSIVEVHVVAPHWAFARTNSSGSVKVKSSGASSPEANQELFVLQKEHGHWKIARYAFSSVNPPHAA